MIYPNDTSSGTGRASRSKMATADDLLPDVKYLLPGCNVEITMRKGIATVIQNFCRETGAYIYTTADITCVAAQRLYTIPIPYEADVLVVRKLTYYNLDSDGDKEDIGRELFNEEYEIHDDLQEYAIKFKLATAYTPDPTYGSVFVAEVSLLPRYDPLSDTGGCVIPNKFMERWRQGIVSGAIADLAEITGTRWYNKGLAERQRTIYNNIVTEAIDKASISKMIMGGGSAVAATPWV